MEESLAWEPYEVEDNEDQEFKELLTHARENTSQEYAKQKVTKMKEVIQVLKELNQTKAKEITPGSTTGTNPTLLRRIRTHPQSGSMINHGKSIFFQIFITVL